MVGMYVSSLVDKELCAVKNWSAKVTPHSEIQRTRQNIFQKINNLYGCRGKPGQKNTVPDIFTPWGFSISVKSVKMNPGEICEKNGR